MIGTLIEPELLQMIREQKWAELREVLGALDASDIAELIGDLPENEKAAVFRVLADPQWNSVIVRA